MKREWIAAYVLAKPGASIERQEEWQADKFIVGGKMFGMRGGDKEERPIITFKLAPAHGLLLRETYPDIVPGYYMNKEHWNSVYLEGAVSDAIIREMIDESYALIFASLSKKAQKEITDEQG